MIHIRASSLNQAAVCHGYALLATAGRTVATPAMERGTAIHAHLAAGLQGQPVEGEHAREALAILSWWRGQGWAEVPEVEVRLEATTMPPTAWRLAGHADAIYRDARSAVVVDWKTGEGRMLPPIDADYRMIAYGSMSGASTVLRVLVDLREVHLLEATDAHRDSLYSLLDAIAGDPSYSPGPHCDHCLARGACSAYQDEAHHLVPMRLASALPATLTAEDAGRLVVAMSAGRELCDRVEELLKEYVRQGGQVERDGKGWTPSTVETERITDSGAALECLAARHGPDTVAEAMSTSWSAMEKAARAAGATKEEIEQLRAAVRDAGATTTTTAERWTWRKA